MNVATLTRHTLRVDAIAPGFFYAKPSQSLSLTGNVSPLDAAGTHFVRCVIYTTIAALSAKIFPQNRTDFYPDGIHSTQSSRTFFYAYILPVRDLWTARFLRLPFVLTTNNLNEFRIATCAVAIFRCDIYSAVFPQMLPPPPTKTAHDFARLHTTTHN